MRTHALKLHLLEDIVLSASAATTGGHRSLSYIPGANLLGVAAGRLYQHFSRSEQFTVFHSGTVRFGNALPVTRRGVQAYPIPLCLHKPKSEDASVETGSEFFLNASVLEYAEHMSASDPARSQVQQQQLRNGYLGPSLEWVQPLVGFRMKTAINERTGTADTGQLFGYQSLTAGQSFIAEIQFDDEVESALIERVISALDGEVHIGRSRSAQFGRVIISRAESRRDEINTDASQHLLLWCKSDLSLQDKFGQPCIDLPNSDLACELEKEGWQVDMNRTFIRTRRYSPYNSKRRGHDPERQVICGGSALVFCARKAVPPPVALLAGGFGGYRESGLGQFSINDSTLVNMLSGLQIEQELPQPANRVSVQKVAKPPGVVADWLESRLTAGGRRSRAREAAAVAADELALLYRQASRYNADATGDPPRPGPTQWSRVADLAKRNQSGSGDFQKLLTALFEGDNAVCGAERSSDDADDRLKTDLDWSRQFKAVAGDTPASFRGWLKQQLQQFEETQKNTSYVGVFLAELCDRARTLTHRLQNGASK